MSLSRRALTLALILAFFAQLAFGSVQLSLTSDEPPHFAHGYVALTTGDTWALLEHRHPPLLNVWGAWPLLLQPERPDPRAVPGWGTDFVVFVRGLWPRLGPVERLAFVTRYPHMLLGVLLMALVCRWTRERGGPGGALLALVVMAFDPTMVAHAQLNTTDVGTALFAFAGVYLAMRPAGNRPWLSTVGAGLALGAAMASKGSGVMLAPVIVAVMGWQWAHAEKSDPARAVRRWIAHAALALAVSLLLLWASYGLRLDSLPGTGLRLPLAAHARMVRRILAEKARTAFLAGEIRQGGWWWYFPFAFAVKTPIPILILIGAAALRRPNDAQARRTPLRESQTSSEKRRWNVHPSKSAQSVDKSLIPDKRRPNPTRSRWGQALAFWAFPALYLAVAVRSGMNIGYRHLLPLFPFLYTAIGSTRKSSMRKVKRRKRKEERKTLFVLHPSSFVLHTSYFILLPLLAWLILGTLRVYPFGLAYFNELVGGPRNGYRYLVDSNSDWGQSFKALKSYMDREGVESVRLSYYTWIDPAAYGVRYRPLPPAPDAPPTFERPFDPAPGVYAISATPLQGVMLAQPEAYDGFRHREPVAQPGYGLLVYEVEPRAAEPGWVAQCAAPAAPLTAEAIAEGFGRADLRQIAFDCAGGWIYPGGAPGWFALPLEVARSGDPFVAARLAGARLSYEQRVPRALPPFALYEQPAGAPAPAAQPETPFDLGALAWLGYEIAPPARRERRVELATWWRVDAVPARPLSLMLHLVGPGGQPALVADGLAVPREAWQAGDVIVQRHTLELPADAPPGAYTPLTGVYWLDSLERWVVETGPQAGADAIALPPVNVR